MESTSRLGDQPPPSITALLDQEFEMREINITFYALSHLNHIARMNWDSPNDTEPMNDACQYQSIR